MATFNRFDAFVEAVAEGKHDFSSDTLRVYLTNVTPNASADAEYLDLADLSTGGGYTAKGEAAALTSSSQTGGTYTLILADPTTWTGSGGGFGPFRYAVLYNDSATNDDLIAYWDYGSSISVSASETFDVDMPASAVITITSP